MELYTKLAALIWLCIHNAVHNLLVRYSRARNVEKMYFSSVAVFLTEILKVLLCFTLVFVEEGGLIKAFLAMQRKIIGQPRDTLKICIPAVLYTIQNNLLFVAASHLEAVNFAVISQLKIFSAAIFSVIILKRQLSKAQWFSFFILFTGVAFVQLGNNSINRSSKNNQDQSPIFGFCMTCLACIISGFAGVFFEKIFKDSSPVTIWMRNIQIAVFSIPASFVGVLIQDYNNIIQFGFLNGFDSIVWITIFWFGIGGLSVAVCIKYADNISKDFATSLAIILATIGSIYIFSIIPNFYFVIGAALVIFSIFLYSSSISVIYKYLTAKTDNDTCFFAAKI